MIRKLRSFIRRDEGSAAIEYVALLLPLTHVTDAAREIMIDGAGIVQVGDHLLVLGISSVVLLYIGARIFQWE